MVQTVKWLPNIPPVFSFGQKRWKHIQAALVKESVVKDEVEGSEQRGRSLLEEMSVISPIVRLSYTESEIVIPHAEDERSASWPSVVYSFCYHPDLLQQNSASVFAERVTKRAPKTILP